MGCCRLEKGEYVDRSPPSTPRRCRSRDAGFTLIELLVVITILGILAAVVGLSVSGTTDRGQDAAARTDAGIIRTAEEAYCAKNGVYGTLADLSAPGGFLAGTPPLNSVVLTSAGSCGGTGFVIGNSAFSSTRGPLFLAAANNTPSFSFLASSFIAANRAVQFSFGASSGLATRADTAADPSVLFASADEANVDKTIVTTDPGPVAGSAGTCTTTCLGIGSTKVQYTTGRLAVFSCRAGGATLPPASGAPACKMPVGGYLTNPPSTPADVVGLLTANPSFKLAIADPGALPPGSGPLTAPYGLAAFEALTSAAAGGGGLTLAQFNALHASGQIVYGANVTATQTSVVSGAVNMAMIPRSFVVSPSGNDTDNWTTVSQTLHNPIRQWAVVLDKGSAADRGLAQSFLDYLLSVTGRSVLAAFGYDPVS